LRSYTVTSPWTFASIGAKKLWSPPLALILHAAKKHLEGLEMKTFFAVIFLSVMSAILGVFAVTELCDKAIAAGVTSDAARARKADANPSLPRQKIQQWVNN